MLIEFNIENFRSIKNQTTFSMQTAPYLKRFKENNTFLTQPVNLLKSAIIFGANGSGKTNLIRAIDMLKNILLNFGKQSIKNQSKLPFQPFKMVEGFNKKFTSFEITLLLNGVMYKYIFRYKESLIDYEALFLLNKESDKVIFERTYNAESEEYIYQLAKGVDDLKSKTRKTAPYLSVLATYNNEYAMNILEWLDNNLIIINANESLSGNQEIFEKLENKEVREKIIGFLKVADFNIIDIEVRKRKQKFPENFKPLFEFLELEQKNDEDLSFDVFDLFTIYNKYNAKGKVIGKTNLHVDSYESRGTKKMILISLILIDALESGKTILIDEFDNALHIEISQFLLKIFNSEIYNKNCQFILNSHDLSLLTEEIMRVDQVWFVEKDKNNSSDFYSLYDFNETSNRARSDMSYAKEYIKGKFGALPIINESMLSSNIFNRGV